MYNNGTEQTGLKLQMLIMQEDNLKAEEQPLQHLLQVDTLLLPLVL